MRQKILLVLSVLILVGLSACAVQRSAATPRSSVPMNYRWANVGGSQFTAETAGEQFYFNIFVDDGMVAEGAPIKMQISGQVESGRVRFELRQPDGRPVWSSGSVGPGDFSFNAEYPLPAGITGTYTLGLVYEEHTSLTYNLGWHALRLGPTILFPAAGMILVALAFVVYAGVRRLLGWRFLGLGALFWVLTVVLKFAFAIPVNPLVFRALGVNTQQLFAPANLLAYLYIGALTGIFEAGLAWLLLARIRVGKGPAGKTPLGKASWNQALVFGIGFGAIEAFLLGFASLASALAGLLAPQALPISALGGLATNATFVMGLAPVVERLAVIFAHIFACALIFYAIASRQARWGWLAILYKTLLDAPGGFAAFWDIGAPANLWTIEAVIIVFGLIALCGSLWLARRYPQE